MNITKEHIAQNHTFTCDDCNESFRTVQKEKSHFCRSFHCECGAKFKEEEDLTAHECHRCKYCDEPFPNSTRLLKHTRAHLNVNTGDYESRILRQEPLNIWTSEKQDQNCDFVTKVTKLAKSHLKPQPFEVF